LQIFEELVVCRDELDSLAFRKGHVQAIVKTGFVCEEMSIAREKMGPVSCRMGDVLNTSRLRG